MSKATVSIQRRGKDRNGEPHEIHEFSTNVIPRKGDLVRIGAAGLRLVVEVVCEYSEKDNRYLIWLE